MRVLGHLSHVQLSATLQTVAHQAPLSMGFSRREYWSGLPCPPPGDRPGPGMEPASPTSPALAWGGGCGAPDATRETLPSTPHHQLAAVRQTRGPGA